MVQGGCYTIKRLVGSLMYLRPDILYGVILISSFMETPKEPHWKAWKRILRYVNGRKDFGIKYSTSKYSRFIGYSDSDCGSSIDYWKSTYVYTFHFWNHMMSWESRKQHIVPLSSAEAQYVPTRSTSSEAVWMRMMLKDLLLNKEPTIVFCDNNSTIMLECWNY